MANMAQMAKLQKRLNKMFDDNDIDHSFIDMVIDKQITDKLLDHQMLHLRSLISSVKDYNIAVDGSGTGTGKTYTAIATCKHFDLIPIILCPKTMIKTWKNVCGLFNCNKPIIVNYETMKHGNQYVDNDVNNERIDSNVININSETKKYSWNVTKKHMLIVDEAHKCKSKTTLNGKMLMAAKNKCKILLLSASIADSPRAFYVFGFILGFFRTQSQCNNWVNNILNAKLMSMTQSNPMHEYLFPKYGSVMYLSEIDTVDKKNIIIPTNYTIDKKSEIIINNLTEQLSKTEFIEINKILIMRQQIELIKANIIIELTEKYINCGHSIAIFINFVETLNNLKKKLKTDCVIHGNLTDDEKQKNISDFQKNKEKIIICTLQSGGQSINLHDTNGKHPRVSIISPSYSSIDLVQSLGRIYRAGTKSHAIQHIVFCGNTHEENICENIKKKINFMSGLTDDDLSLKI